MIWFYYLSSRIPSLLLRFSDQSPVGCGFSAVRCDCGHRAVRAPKAAGLEGSRGEALGEVRSAKRGRGEERKGPMRAAYAQCNGI
ncbi:hypothetical protein WR25_15582 [Diploscapter pachys]|uniref:Uncharacterized protein n=1 Tax=Diploscapter pachys TaxID=2018661 RepID=A0A2A2LAM3_9BILA|nr:hypothetical protein WR25_15582 [Diploscapter pachys]